MMKKLIFIAIFLSLGSSLFASYSEGYIIKLKRFTLMTRYMSYNSTDDIPKNVVSPDGLFWNLLSWVYNNKVKLEVIEAYITVYVHYRKKGYSIYLDYLDHDAKNLSLPYKPETIGDTVCGSLDVVFDLPPSKNSEDIKIDLYMISAQSNENYIINQLVDSDIFIGALPGSMYNHNTGLTFILFWYSRDARKYMDNHKNEDYTLQNITLSKGTILEVFGTMWEPDLEQMGLLIQTDMGTQQTPPESAEVIASDPGEQDTATETPPEETSDQNETEPQEITDREKPVAGKYRLLVVSGICFLIIAGVIYAVVYKWKN